MPRELTVEASVPISKNDRSFEAMSDFHSFEHSQKLTINRARCIDRTIIDNFLRYLRHGSDDVLKLKLNNYRMSSSNTKKDQCTEFLESELFPNWKKRDSVISFCEEEANLMKCELDEHTQPLKHDGVPFVTERIDPYSMKNILEEKQACMKEWESLSNWVEGQKSIERIMQIRASSILGESCGRTRDYLKEFEKFTKIHK